MSPRAPRAPREHARGACLRSLLCVLVSTLVAAACSSTEADKRLLQYLNDSGFGNRYTGNAEEQNYVTIGDTVAIDDAYNPDLTALIEVVDIDGTIVLPEIGAVHVAGLTRSDLEAFLLQKYSPYYEELDIDVKITSTTGKFFFVFGEVQRSGAQPFLGDLTVFQAVMAAVPDKRTANLGRVRLIRGDPRDPNVIPINIGEMMTTGDMTFNVLVQERDIVYVPPTMLAQLGYFLSYLIFPITQVLTELGQALFYFRGPYYGSSGAIF